MIRIGTSGFSYQDWEGPFYPRGLASGDRLSFYASEFNTVEINSSYYRVPTASTLLAMSQKTPDGFIFTIKANRQMTHERNKDTKVFRQYQEALRPWVEQHCLGCVLAQFPFAFDYAPPHIDYLRWFREQMGDLPVIVEFRHASWLSGRVFELLRELNMGICCVDQPQLGSLLPPFAVVTSDVAYVRFHGRNGKKWWNHEQAWERYDYTYTQDELEPWTKKALKMDTQARTTFLFANNHWIGQAVDTARQLRLLLGMNDTA